MAPSGAYVRFSTEADKVCLCTRYDVRCTIWEFSARCAGGAELKRAECDKAMRERSYKAAMADGVCLCTRYD